MNRKDVVVVIPFYHTNLNTLESISYANCLKILNKYKIILLIPTEIDKEKIPNVDQVTLLEIPKKNMESVQSYNLMMLSKEFYEHFKQYSYVLIFQLDAFVFCDKLLEFCEMDYDYLGAPWVYGLKYLTSKKIGAWYVGNGGLSLRRVSAFLDFFKKGLEIDYTINEDAFWSSCNSDTFHVAPLNVALQFAFERDVRRCFELNGRKLPFGCHAWEKYDFVFWRSYFQKMGWILPSDFIGEMLDEKEKNTRQNCGYLNAKSEEIQTCLGRLGNTSNKTIYIFGGGFWGQECCWMLQKVAEFKVFWVDNNSLLWNKEMYGITIQSPIILRDAPENAFIIIAVGKHINEISLQLQEYGFRSEYQFCTYDVLRECIVSEMKNFT